MKIEILLTELGRKTEVLTHLAKDPEIRAGGNELEVPGLRLEVGESYLFFTITRWQRAQETVPLLFSVHPAHSAYTFRPESGQKVLVTCRARPIPDMIPELTAVEHLDLEAGELAGAFQVTWNSHDVAVSAQAALMVQGGVAVARIKFATHARDSEYHCRACIDLISVQDILAVFCGEPLTTPVLPLTGPVVIEGRAQVEGDGWATFVNTRAWPSVTFDRAAGELKMTPGPGSTITFRQGKGKSTEVLLRLQDPGLVTDDLAADAAELLGLKEVRAGREISGAVLDLDRLRRELDFRSGERLALFSRAGDFITTYDAGRLQLTMEAVVPLEDPGVQEKVARLCREMEAFTVKVMACAV